MKKVFLSSVMMFFIVIGYSQGYSPGSKATDFKLLNVDGNMVSMMDFPDAKGFIIIFTCNSCPYSVAYEDRKIALSNKYRALGYPVIALNPNDSLVQPKDSFSKMIVRSKEKRLPYPYLLDTDQKVAKQYGATRTPHVYVLQKEKDDLIVKYIGAIDNNYEDAASASERYVEAAVDALLQGKDVAVSSTKAIGCGIKFKK